MKHNLWQKVNVRLTRYTCTPVVKMSAVWKYFNLENESSPTATCSICNTSISRGGNKRAAYNTTNLIRHLKNKHPNEHIEFTRASQAKAPTQKTLAEVFKKKEKYPRDSYMAKHITEKIIEFIALDIQPISVVEDKGFRRLLEFLNPRYDLPSRHYLSDTALPEMYSKVRDHLRGNLREVTALSFTTDIWSSDVCPMSLLSLTAHWIDSLLNYNVRCYRLTLFVDCIQRSM